MRRAFEFVCAQQDERVSLFRLEDIGSSADTIYSSPFLEAIGASDVSFDDVEKCATVASDAAHNTADQGAEGAATSGTELGYSWLPTEDELHDALLAEPALLVSLCHIYAQDSLCLAAHYAPPTVCRELLAP